MRFLITLILIFTNIYLIGQCPNTASLSNNSKCIQVGWDITPMSLPTIDNYTYSSGTNPAIYFKSSGDNNGCMNYGLLTGSIVIAGTTCIYTDGVLPVGFSSISVQLIGSITHISFSTTSETNNDYFTIERSTDGRSFDPIGKITGAGNSSKEIHYSFTDENPLPGINYYRIKQTDFDGMYSYSEIRSVRMSGIRNITVTPRTTDGRLEVNTELEDYSIAVYNAAGQEVKMFRDLSSDQYLHIDELKAGLYFLRVVSGSDIETIRVVKL